MAAEAAQAEIAAPRPPTAPGASPSPSPEKRRLQAPDEAGGEEDPPPEPKRRRARVAALDGVICPPTAAAAAGEETGPGSGRDASFSFQHAGAGFAALETTPKFGSFNPPAAAEPRGLEVRPAPRDGEVDEQVPVSSSPSAGAEEDGSDVEWYSQAQSVVVDEAGGGQGHADRSEDSVLTFDHH